MKEQTPQRSKKFRGIVIPLILSILIGILIYYGGDAYQTIGLAGIGTARLIFGYLLGIIEFLLIAVLLQRLVQYLLLDWLVASAIGSQPPRLLSQLASFVIYLLAVAAIIGIVFKKDLTVVLAASGAIGVIIGLALRNLILDVFAGLAMNLDRIVKIGDNILLHRIGNEPIEGKLVEISWRTMQILDLRNNIIIVPNYQVFASTITNYSAPQPFFEIAIPVALDSKVPVQRAIRVLEAAAIETLATFDLPGEVPPPLILVTEITYIPRSVKYSVLIHVPFEKRADCHHQVQQQILKHLSFAGIRPALQDKPEAAYLATLLTATPLFQGLPEEEAKFLATHAQLKHVAPNIQVACLGDIAEAMFFVIEGLLVAETRRGIGSKALPPEIVSPGHVIGSVPMLMNDVYEATVTTKTTCLLFEVDYKLLEKVLFQHPEVANVLTRNIARIMIDNTASSSSQWQMDEADITSEVRRNLKRRFGHLKLG